MSGSAILQSVRDILRAGVPFGKYECEVRVGPEPTAESGQEYCSVYLSGWDPGPDTDGIESIDEEYRVTVGYSQRIGEFPLDRLGQEVYLKSLKSIEPVVRRIISTIMNNKNEILGSANSYLASGDPPFLTPPVWQGTTSPPKFVFADFYLAEPEDPLAFGLLSEINFGGCRRMQTLGAMS